MMKFTITNNINDRRIIPFLITDKRATIYHHPAWLKAISKTFGHTAYYLILENNNAEIEGLFPFIAATSIITGKRIISLPFTNYCDPLLDKEIFAEAIEEIKEALPEFRELDIRTLGDYSDSLKKFSLDSLYFTHILILGGSIDETFKSFHPTSVRASIRRSEKHHLGVRQGTNLDDLKSFYHLEVSLRKRLSLPPLPFLFYKNIWHELSKYDLISIPLIIKDDKVIAAGFILNFKDTYYLEYTASNRRFINSYPNHKLFFEVIKTAHLKHATKVDFGRSSIDNESLIKFKEKWNTTSILINHYHVPKKTIIKKKQHHLKKYLMKINSLLPEKVLELQGRLIYPHLG